MKHKRTDHTWFIRYYADEAGQRVYKKTRVGTVREFPTRSDAERASLSIRTTINAEVRIPAKVSELIAHYRKHELIAERKAFSTIDSYESYLDLYIGPTWGEHRLSGVRTVAVEQWLHKLPLAPGTRTKIRNILSALFSHAIRHEWMAHNPISKVRASATRLREPDVLTPDEFRFFAAELGIRERAMVILAGTTGLRRSEMFALRWRDVNFSSMQVAILRAVVRNRFGNVKTPASKRPVPLHPSVLDELNAWRRISPYRDDDDFLFPSVRLNGTKPVTPDMVLKKILRPALKRAGIVRKIIGWHSFRHSLATNLRSLGVDVKVAQELLRHANSRITMDIYTRAVSSEKRIASGRQVEMLTGV